MLFSPSSEISVFKIVHWLSLTLLKQLIVRIIKIGWISTCKPDLANGGENPILLRPHCQPIHSELSFHNDLRAVGHPDYGFLLIKKNAFANKFQQSTEKVEEPEVLERLASVFSLQWVSMCATVQIPREWMTPCTPLCCSGVCWFIWCVICQSQVISIGVGVCIK